MFHLDTSILILPTTADKGNVLPISLRLPLNAHILNLWFTAF